MKVEYEITQLKINWLNDPCFDIEDTEGFEDHRKELLAFRQHAERKWAEKREADLAVKADAIGCPGNLKLAAYVKQLEQRLFTLEHHRV